MPIIRKSIFAKEAAEEAEAEAEEEEEEAEAEERYLDYTSCQHFV